MAKVKKRDHEKLSDSNVQRVIDLLEAENPITKKAACEILNISYNTSRLDAIIEQQKERQALSIRKRKENRGKPASSLEIARVIEDYLDGEPVGDIANRLFRSSAFVKGIVDQVGIPSRPSGEDKYKESLLPEQCQSDTFSPGQTVWSSIYHGPARVIKELTNMDYEKVYGSKAYQVYVMEKVETPSPYFPSVQNGGFFSNHAAYEIGSLEHLFKYGVQLNVD